MQNDNEFFKSANCLALKNNAKFMRTIKNNEKKLR